MRHLRRGSWIFGTALALASVPMQLAGALPLRTTASRTRSIQVVAAENVWGSVATQLGGTHVHVTSIITNPNTDPHSYEPTAVDARTLAGAQFVIENAIGYDPWVARLLAADSSHPMVLSVGKLLGLAPGSNPHRWYNPADLQRVIAQIVVDYQRLDPSDRAYFSRQQQYFENVALRSYHKTIAAIRRRYAGTPVGASESIFAMLAPALGLKLMTPSSFLKAISEGTDVSARDKETSDRQIKKHEIKIYVYNTQNLTPDVQAQLDAARAAHIPVATITETLAPPTATYEQWQTKQLLGLQAALARATKAR